MNSTPEHHCALQKGLSWRLLFLFAIAALLPLPVVAVGSWTNLVNNAPGPIELMLLLPDGTIMAQQAGASSSWYRLTPDTRGSYINGNWSTLAPSIYSHQYYASAVLQDGRIFVAGGEYGTGGNKAEIYDPQKNTWTEIPVPAGLICTTCSGPGFSDADCIILPNGNLLIAPVQPVVANGTVIFNLSSNTFSAGPSYLNNQNEATWVKLPDSSILTIDAAVNTSQAVSTTERFVPSLNNGQGGWIVDQPTPVSMYNSAQEIGAGLLLPDGRAVFIGGADPGGVSPAHILYYTPTGNNNPGSWTQGPDLPQPAVGWDEPAALLINGKILLQTVCAPLTNPQPRCYYELDPGNNYPVGTLTPVPTWPGGVDTSGFSHIMLTLPDGKLVLSYGSSNLKIYLPDGVPVATAKPTIASIAMNANGSYHLVGTQLNGLSQGSSFGDDAQMDSNFPLVRLTDGSGNVYYARTYHWSSTGVMTGNTPVSTEFSLPTPAYGAGGPLSLVVVANGISSDPVSFTPLSPNVWVDFNSIMPFEFGSFVFPDKTLTKGVTDVPNGGIIAIKPGSSTETLRINKPTRIIAIGGSASIGHGH
jgi:hypothetical protein